MEITPYEGLNLITTVADEDEVEYLLDDKDGKRLLCDNCDAPSFKVKVLIEAELNVLVGSFTRQLFVRDQDIKAISVIKVIQCATCGSEDFIREESTMKDKQTENNHGR